jgi:hypothetical protein
MARSLSHPFCNALPEILYSSLQSYGLICSYRKQKVCPVVKLYCLGPGVFFFGYQYMEKLCLEKKPRQALHYLGLAKLSLSRFLLGVNSN